MGSSPILHCLDCCLPCRGLQGLLACMPSSKSCMWYPAGLTAVPSARVELNRRHGQVTESGKWPDLLLCWVPGVVMMAAAATHHHLLPVPSATQQASSRLSVLKSSSATVQHCQCSCRAGRLQGVKLTCWRRSIPYCTVEARALVSQAQWPA
jgi:hypothetical protein